MRTVNKVTLIGNTGTDPEIRVTKGGTKIASVSLATNYKSDTVDRTQWHHLKFFGKLADIVEQYIRKGESLYVEGRIDYSTSEGDGGQKRYWTDIVVREMVMLGSKGSDGTSNNSTIVPSTEDNKDLPF